MVEVYFKEVFQKDGGVQRGFRGLDKGLFGWIMGYVSEVFKDRLERDYGKGLNVKLKRICFIL